jgi:hypothetical protein
MFIKIMLILLTSFLIMYFWNYDLRRDVACIELNILDLTPYMLKFDEVVQKLEVNDYKISISKNSGFMKQENGKFTVVGVSSIRSHIGDYWEFPFFRTSVTVFWGFNVDGRLTDVWVWKTTDAL